MRKLFGTDGVRGTANKYPVTADIALKLGKAAALILTKGKKKPVFVIGKDTRLSGYMLENSLTAGLTSMGAEVYLVGPMPTPAVAHLVKSFAADAGIMISASHNPYTDNGIKFFDKKGHKLPDDVEEKIEEMVLNGKMSTDHISSKDIGRAYRIEDARGRYIEYAKATTSNTSLKGLKIVLDCANGAAYKVAPLILRELGAEVIVLNNEPDGNNINVGCGALHPEVTRKALLDEKADVGITLDGDADRIIMVDDKGNILDGDHILFVAGKYYLEKGLLNKNTIVATQYTNLAFDELIEKYGGKVVRTKNGDRYVIEKMLGEGYNVGGEYTGHIIFSDYNPTGDGMISGLQILRIMKEKRKKLSELAGELKKYPNVLINVMVKEKTPLDKIDALNKALEEADRKLGKTGRYIVRYSGTEMKARVMVEGKGESQIEKIAEKIADTIRKEVGA